MFRSGSMTWTSTSSCPRFRTRACWCSTLPFSGSLAMTYPSREPEPCASRFVLTGAFPSASAASASLRLYACRAGTGIRLGQLYPLSSDTSSPARRWRRLVKSSPLAHACHAAFQPLIFARAFFSLSHRLPRRAVTLLVRLQTGPHFPVVCWLFHAAWAASSEFASRVRVASIWSFLTKSPSSISRRLLLPSIIYSPVRHSPSRHCDHASRLGKPFRPFPVEATFCSTTGAT